MKYYRALANFSDFLFYTRRNGEDWKVSSFVMSCFFMLDGEPVKDVSPPAILNFGVSVRIKSLFYQIVFHIFMSCHISLTLIYTISPFIAYWYIRFGENQATFMRSGPAKWTQAINAFSC